VPSLRSPSALRLVALALAAHALFGCASVVPPRDPRAPRHASAGSPSSTSALSSRPAPRPGGSPAANAPAPTGSPDETGEASYYADKLAGRKTASGEPYDPRALTAAHRTLAFGTWLEVRRGERRVRVKVNDRGPYAHGRVIDLSRAAAEALGLVRAGVGEVELFVLGRD